MNYIQHRFEIPLSNVFKEDKADYYKALIDTRKNENPDIFRVFMLNQYIKMLENEIAKTQKSMKEQIFKNPNKGDLGISMIF